MESKPRASFATLLILASALIVCTSACTKPRKTTAVGSGVGGVIGAGLGAIIGNQSGNAGSGVAIGAGAGAAVGAIVGNALQAQEERNVTQDEAIKRQERVIQAQRNEINELRSVRGDDSFSLNRSAHASTQASAQASPRYHYRGTKISPESPEVARQRAKLQQRGPRPRNTSGEAVYSSSYYSDDHRPSEAASRKTAPPVSAVALTPKKLPTATLPEATLPEASTAIRQPLARYDLRSDLTSSDTKAPADAAVPPKAEIAPAGSEAAKSSSDIKETTPKKIVAPVMPAAAGDISESDISAPQASNQSTTRSTSSTAASATQSKECKEALAERDRAAEASDNSDKLFHLRRALRLCPQSAPLHHELGKVYGSMQRTKDAEDEFKQALSIDPSFSAAKRELGALLKDEIQF
jgi:hypothetical protein